MKKQTLADKLAQKAFNSPKFQESWAVHMQAFGPILESAFAEDYQARVHLTAALNHISSRNLAQGLAKLKQLQNSCVTDADKTAFLFFMGLLQEMAGNQEQMLAFYTYANEYGHSFYMPYLKVGKFYLNGCMYDEAEENLRTAIGCFTATGLDEQSRIILGSTYSNLASCLTMMHRYDEAEEAISHSRSLYPDAPGRAAVEAVLYAIRGDRAQVETCLATLKGHAPAVWEGVKESTDKILALADPKFFPIPLDEEKIAGFWHWFTSYSTELHGKLDREEYEAALTPVSEKLLEVFPFLEESPNIALGKNDAGYVLELQDMYAVAIMEAYEKLLLSCPEEIKSQWQFAVVH